MKKIPILLFILFLYLNSAIASDIVEIFPLTNKIIMIHFKDGYAVYHKIGQARSDERVVVSPLSISFAEKLTSYIITSNDDPAYTSGLNPIELGRKTKGREFTWMCQSWDATKGCINTDPDHVKEHWVYITLPNAMVSGKTYTVYVGPLAGNGFQWTFKFDEFKIRSEAVHVNQIGYAPAADQKFGYVYHWMGSKGGLDLTSFNNTSFNLVDQQTGQSAFSGKLVFRKSKTNHETSQTIETPNGNFLSADVYECDFSSFKTPGEYVLSIEGIGCSYPFSINDGVYRQVFYTTVRGLYLNRSGIELKQANTEFTRPAPHNPNITPGFAGRLHYTTSRFVDWKSGDNDQADKPAIEAGDKGALNTWGWYQDAGDWDGYYTHSNVPAILMFTWETAPNNFKDNELNIPESGNGIPDILDEAQWLLRYFYRTRHAIIDKGYGTGGIGTRVFGDLWGSDEDPNGKGRGSWQDNTRTWYVSGEDPFSTYKYSALAAQMAYCLKSIGITDDIDWKKEAIESYDWAKNNTKSGDEGNKPAIGFSLKDIRAYAAASLYRLTEDPVYHNQLISDLSSITSSSKLSEEARWAPYIYTNMAESTVKNADLYNRLSGAVISTGDNVVSSVNSRACRFGGDYSMPMLVGQATTPLVFEAILAYKLVKSTDAAKASKYLSAIYTTADYFLGCNPLNTTWITGLGKRQPERVFHMDSWYNGKLEMVPGITPYGPWRVESYTTGQGAWDMKWPYKTLYPTDINIWPGHERWFSNYTCPMNAEYTIHQNTIFNAAVFGFLCNNASADFVPNRKPVVSFKTPAENSEIKQYDKVAFTVNASDPDGDDNIWKVEYYNNWHKVGESFSAPYSYDWENTSSGMLNLTARIYDKFGVVGRTDTLLVNAMPNGIESSLKDKISISAYPNPFDSEITFNYSLKSESRISIEIIDINGKKIKTLSDSKKSAGNYSVKWNGTNNKEISVKPGIYFTKIMINDKSNTYIDTIKVIYSKLD